MFVCVITDTGMFIQWTGNHAHTCIKTKTLNKTGGSKAPHYLKEEHIMEWYYIVLLCIAGVILLSGFTILLFKNTKFRKAVYNWVLQAEERIAGSKMGQEKFAFVVARIHEWIEGIPVVGKWLHLIFTEAIIAKIIEKAVARMKETLQKEADKKEAIK